VRERPGVGAAPCRASQSQGGALPRTARSPAHALAQRQMRRFGSLIALTLADAPTAEAFIGHCRFVRAATSFGGVHTSAERPGPLGRSGGAGFHPPLRGLRAM